MRRLSPFLVILQLLFIAACVPGTNNYVDTMAEGAGSPAGFLLGLWHGLIIFFTLVLSLFTENVSLYEVHNSGGWYDFGFFLGASSALGGGTSAATRK